MFERFSKPARDVVIHARAQAARLNQTEVRAEHLLLALAAPEAGTSARVLKDNGLTCERIENAIASTVALESGEGPLTRSDAEALKAIGIDLDEIIRQVEGALGPGAFQPTLVRHRSPDRRLTFSSEAKHALAASLAEARRQGSDHIRAEHILLGVLAQRKSLAAEVLGLLDVTPESLRDQVLTEERRAS